MRYPYIKPTRRKHDSGFRCFEVGYCERGAKNQAINIQVLGQCSDHILLSSFINQNSDINLDLTTNGYIRIYSMSGDTLEWRSPYCLSTMVIKSRDAR